MKLYSNGETPAVAVISTEPSLNPLQVGSTLAAEAVTVAGVVVVITFVKAVQATPLESEISNSYVFPNNEVGLYVKMFPVKGIGAPV